MINFWGDPLSFEMVLDGRPTYKIYFSHTSSDKNDYQTQWVIFGTLKSAKMVPETLTYYFQLPHFQT